MDERVRVIVPLSSNVFSKAYGIIEDPFGIQIQLIYDDWLHWENQNDDRNKKQLPS